MAEILIVDDEANIRRMLASLLEAEGFAYREAATGAEAIQAIEASEPDAVLLDLVLPEMSGLDVLRRAVARRPEMPVIMMSGRATLSDAVQATKLGAFHFLEKPVAAEAVLVHLRAALEFRKARDLTRALQTEFGAGVELVGQSRAMEELLAAVRRVAPTDARVVITGESGTGKELVASAIHALSKRARGPFVRVNCAAIPRDLIESEMFGHEKGAFTGATERRRGKFELADGGTLFMDEIGELAPRLQAKLLRALETGTFFRVGGTRQVSANIRLIAATNRDIARAVEEGAFRQDLYYRISTFTIHVPPLRERPADIPVLARHFLARARPNAPELSDDALDVLKGYEWPGNVRELKNVMERLAVLATGPVVTAADLPPDLHRGPVATRGDGPPTRIGDAVSLDDVEREHIAAVLRRTQWHQGKAAEILGISPKTLYRKIREYGLRRPA